MRSRILGFRRMSKAVPCFVLMLLGGTGLVACGGGVAGTYVAKETSPDGETMSMSLELKGGKKAVMTMKNSGQEGSMSVDGTYSVEGEKVTVMLAGDPTVFTRKGGKLIANAFGEETVLVKQ